jgi:hypothetical protein
MIQFFEDRGVHVAITSDGKLTGVSHLLHIHYIGGFSIMSCSVPEFMNSVTSADKYFIA